MPIQPTILSLSRNIFKSSYRSGELYEQQRKVEEAACLIKGSSDPVFANALNAFICRWKGVLGKKCDKITEAKATVAIMSKLAKEISGKNFEKLINDHIDGLDTDTLAFAATESGKKQQLVLKAIELLNQAIRG